jgi:hypothetical protein
MIQKPVRRFVSYYVAYCSGTLCRWKINVVPMINPNENSAISNRLCVFALMHERDMFTLYLNLRSSLKL